MSVVTVAEKIRRANASVSGLDRSFKISPSPSRGAHDDKSEATAEKEAGALLNRVLGRIGLVTTPMIQLMPCIPDERASDIALSLAVAAAANLGRALLIDVTHVAVQTTQAGSAASALMTARDVFVPALHHAHIGPFLLDRRNGNDNIQHTLAAAAKSFRLLVLDCPSAKASPESLALAHLCSGTVLIVHAGRTRIADVLAASREIESAGGRVLGTVLTQVPQRLPAWINPEAAA